MNWQFGLRDDLGIVRETVRLRIETVGERRKVALFATKRLLVVVDRGMKRNSKTGDERRLRTASGGLRK